MRKNFVSSQKGFSLMEILVVIAIFSVLAIVASSAVLLSLRGSRKAEGLISVRENIDYSLSVIARNIRNADSIDDCSNSDPLSIYYIDQEGILTSFSCDLSSSPGYIASSSARLTNDTVNITACSFTCIAGTSGNPDSIKVAITASDTNLIGAEAAEVSASTQVFLRTY